jgi:hypothetical protein
MRLSPHGAESPASEPEVPAHYLFIVARDRPDILARVRERLREDGRIDVIVDRRHGERRRDDVAPSSERRHADVAQSPERRHADRRRPTRHWDDLSVYPTLVVQKRVESYAELRQENERLRVENARLREAVLSLERRIEAAVVTDAALTADAAATLAQAETVIGALLARFRDRLVPPPRPAS